MSHLTKLQQGIRKFIPRRNLIVTYQSPSFCLVDKELDWIRSCKKKGEVLGLIVYISKDPYLGLRKVWGVYGLLL